MRSYDRGPARLRPGATQGPQGLLLFPLRVPNQRMAILRVGPGQAGPRPQHPDGTVHGRQQQRQERQAASPRDRCVPEGAVSLQQRQPHQVPPLCCRQQGF